MRGRGRGSQEKKLKSKGNKYILLPPSGGNCIKSALYPSKCFFNDIQACVHISEVFFVVLLLTDIG